jgi:TetR/AcrR family transcriptional repressor of nem operon
MARPAKYPRETMLERALELFWTKGYEGTSVQDLLDALDIHKGTLYDSFGDKHALYMEVLAHYQRTLGGQLLAVLTQPGSKKAAIQELFDRLVTSLASPEGKRGCLFTNATMELALSDAQVAPAVSQSHSRLADAFDQALTEAQQAGEIPLRSPQEVRGLAQFLVSNIQGLRVLARTSPGEDTLRQVAKIALTTLY